jgi:protein-L-isoaspartate(D-aspartate) O-methyltransferase
MTDFSELRVKMVDGQVRTTDVTNLPLLTAMLDVPRELFVPESRKALAYIDENILLTEQAGQGRYLMKPSPFAKMAQAAEIGSDDRVLVVGAGTGYSAAVLSRLARSVVALESDDALAGKAASTLAGLGCDTVTVVRGPLPAGHKQAAPYNVIICEGSVDEVPETLLGQLAEEGRLVVVEGRGNAGAARIYLKSNGVATGRRAFNAAVKPLPGFERAPAFEF